MMKKQEPTAVIVAKITARQAIIVAVISLLGGIAVTLIGSGLVGQTTPTNSAEYSGQACP